MSYGTEPPPTSTTSLDEGHATLYSVVLQAPSFAEGRSMLFALLASAALLRCDPLPAKNATEPNVRMERLRSSRPLEGPASQRAPKLSVLLAAPARNVSFPPAPMGNVVSGELRRGTGVQATRTQARNGSSKDAAIRATPTDSADPQSKNHLRTTPIGHKILPSTAYETRDATSTCIRPAKASSTQQQKLARRPTMANVRDFLTTMLGRPCGTARRVIRRAANCGNLQHATASGDGRTPESGRGSRSARTPWAHRRSGRSTRTSRCG